MHLYFCCRFEYLHNVLKPALAMESPWPRACLLIWPQFSCPFAMVLWTGCITDQDLLRGHHIMCSFAISSSYTINARTNRGGTIESPASIRCDQCHSPGELDNSIAVGSMGTRPSFDPVQVRSDNRACPCVVKLLLLFHVVDNSIAGVQSQYGTVYARRCSFQIPHLALRASVLLYGVASLRVAPCSCPRAPARRVLLTPTLQYLLALRTHPIPKQQQILQTLRNREGLGESTPTLVPNAVGFCTGATLTPDRLGCET